MAKPAPGRRPVRNLDTRRRRTTTAVAAAALTAAFVSGVQIPAHAATPPAAKPASSAAPGPSSPASGTNASAADLAAERTASARAKATGKGVTVDAETDDSALVTANPNGSFTLTEDTSPVRVKQNGAWVPIDPTLVRDKDGTVHPKAGATGVAFSSGGTGPMVVLTQGTDTLSFSWPGTLPAPTLSGADATYADVLPGVNLVLTANAGGYSEALVVENAAAAANPALKTLTLGLKSTGVTVSGTSDGGAQAVDKKGSVVFHADTATMWDAAGASPAPQAAAGSATPATGGAAKALAQTGAAATAAPDPAAQAAQALTPATHVAAVAVRMSATKETLTPDPAMLTAKSTKFPLVIDPAWSGSPSQLNWARISSNGWNIYNSTSTASDDHPREGYDDWAGSADETARTYYQMNLGGSTGTTGIGGADVTVATLYVKNYWAASDGSTPVDVYSTDLIKSWTSSGLNWSNKPKWNADLTYADSNENCSGSTCTSVTPGTLSFSILGDMQSAAAAKANNLTLGLGAPNESDDTEWKQFASGGGASISVTYYRYPDLVGGTGSPVTTPATVQGGTTYVTSHTPTMKITSEDTDGEEVRNDYQIWHWASGAATTSVQTGMLSAFSANGGAYTYTGSLADGTYAWRGTNESETSSLWGPWSKWQVFTVDTTVPTPPSVESPQFPAAQYGGAYGDKGTFTFTNNTSTIAGYIFSLDGDLGTTVYGNSSIVTWTTGTTPVAGKPYWVPASSGYGTASFAPGTVGPHHVYVKAVDSADNTSNETAYLFYAGLTTPTYAYGDLLVNGYTAADGTVVPKATSSFQDGGVLKTQANCCDIQFADPSGLGQGMLANGTSPAVVETGDSATFDFDLPSAGYWDIGANLTEAKDYGKYTLTLDQGTSTAAVLTPTAIDAYSPVVTTAYHDFGTPKNAGGAEIQLAAGLHTLTLLITGTDTASAGYQAGIDVLRLAPMSATCEINNLTACLNNTAISQDTDTAAADADGEGASLSATQLTAAGWSATGTAITVNGAPMTVPGYQTGAADDITASGQLIQVPAASSSFANDGNAIVFLGFATNGAIHDASGVITYTSPCGGSNTQSYDIDTVPDWVKGSASADVIQLSARNKPGNTQDTYKPQIYAMSVPLACPGQAISSITLPVVSNGVIGGVSAMHVLGIGIRASSFTDATNTQNWTASFADRQDADSGTWSNLTFRIPATITVGGTSARIHLSNALGTAPVTFTDVTIAQQSTAGGAAAAAAPVQLTFGGSTSVTIPAGGEITSDPAGITLPQQATVLVSETISGLIANVPSHADIQGNAYYTDGDGVDHAQDTAATAFSAIMDFDPYLTGIDVTSSGNTTGSLVLYGDQTVNADTSSWDGQSHLSDDIANALAADPANAGTVPYGILNLGEDSTATANNVLPPATYNAAALNAVDPVDRQILDQANVRTVLISTGTSDILDNESANTIETQLVSLAQQIRGYTSDTYGNNQAGFVTVYVATIPPPVVAFSAAQETIRETVNNYILCGISEPTAGVCDDSGNAGNSALGGNDDGAVDFAAAVSSDGTDTGTGVVSSMLWEDSNDAYWPGDAYYNALAQQFVTDTTDPGTTVGTEPMIARTGS